MNFRMRVKALEAKARPEQPWLILDIADSPTTEQVEQIAEAIRTGRFTVCFDKALNWAYVAVIHRHHGRPKHEYKNTH